jgi:cobalt transporter subunit CbtB
MGHGAVPHDNTEGDMSRLISVLGTNTSLAAERASAAVVAALLGIFILYGVGFAQISHETAHDTRHATGFPCH